MLDGHHPTRIKSAKASQSQEPFIITWNGNVSVGTPRLTAPPQSLHVYFMWIPLQIFPHMNMFLVYTKLKDLWESKVFYIIQKYNFLEVKKKGFQAHLAHISGLWLFSWGIKDS